MSKLALLALLLALAAAAVLAASPAAQDSQESWTPAALLESTQTEADKAIIYDGEHLAAAEEEQAQPTLLEIEATRTGRGRSRSKRARRQHGWGISPRSPRRVQQRLPSPRLTGAAATLTRANVRCVLCQFIAQKIKNSLTGDAHDEGAAGADAGADAQAQTSLIEAFAFASAKDQSRVESLVAAEANAAAAASAVPALFDHGRDAARRFRHTDILASRATRARFTQVRGNQPGPDTDAQRAAYLKLYSTVYASFEGLCARRMPLAYLPYCNDMLKSYRFFAQGVNYGDRADQICMNGNFCDSRSYVRRVTHATYQREPGDA